MDACQELINGTEISGNIAFVQRGGCEFETKILNAQDAGASAVVVYNIAGPPIPMIPSLDSSGDTTIPALMIGQADGNLILAEIDDGQTVELTLDKGFFLSVEDTGNAMGVFSARGPAPVLDILKPDVTAPGINILAGYTPDAVNSVPDENYAFLTGTSMSTPHVAGVAALLLQSHPDWSPAVIKSALMTSARQDIVQQDGSTPAHAFDFGAGHIDPNRANDPGLVFDISNDEYDAFACGADSPAVSQARCAELAGQGFSFAAADLNLPTITMARLTSARTVTRRVRNVSADTGVYTASVEAPAGIAVQVTPASLTIPPGQSASFEVTMSYQDGPIDLWRFGSLTWSDNDGHTVRSVLTARPVSITAPTELLSSGGTGSIGFQVQFGYNGPYTPRVHGLDRASVFEGFVDNDPTKTFTFRETDGVTAHVFPNIPEDQLLLRFAMFDQLTDGDDDLDMYLYYCPDNITTNARCRKVAESGEKTSREQIDVRFPGPGTYIVFVHGFETDEVAGGPGANYKLLAWQLGLSDDVGNMSATGPGIVSAGTTGEVTVEWSNLGSDSIYLGAISHNTPQGLVAITLISVEN
jgi:hypothetical protein